MAEVRACLTVPVTSMFAGIGAYTPCAPLLVESTYGKLYTLLDSGTVVEVGKAVIVTATLTATGTVQADAYAMTGSVNEFTDVQSGTGARLSSSMTSGDDQLVFNAGANPLKVYPDSGSRINALVTNTAAILATNTACRFTKASTRWVGELSA